MHEKGFTFFFVFFFLPEMAFMMAERVLEEGMEEEEGRRALFLLLGWAWAFPLPGVWPPFREEGGAPISVTDLWRKKGWDGENARE